MAQVSRICRIDTKDIDEASGMAASVKNPGVLWLNNDSGDGAFLYAVDGKSGQLRAYLKLPGVKAKDWESLRLAPDGLFTIADIGDNDSKRKDITLYRVPEPILAPGGPQRLVAPKPQRFPLRYPGGPRNAETLLVHPKTGAHFIITKTDSGISEIYAVPEFRGLQRLGTVRAGGEVTDGAISPNGQELALLTYQNLLLWKLTGRISLTSALQERPSIVPIPKALDQAEAIAYSPDGRMLYVTTEGKKPEVYGVSR